MSRNLNSFSLEDFCRTHRVEEKIIVVPSYRVGHQIGESLAAQGVPWINMRFLTLPGLADGVAGPEVAELISNIQLTAEADHIKLSFSLSNELLEKLREKAQEKQKGIQEFSDNEEEITE